MCVFVCVCVPFTSNNFIDPKKGNLFAQTIHPQLQTQASSFMSEATGQQVSSTTYLSQIKK